MEIPCTLSKIIRGSPITKRFYAFLSSLNPSLPTPAGFCVQARLSVCLSVCRRSNRKTAWAINTKLGTPIRYSSSSAYIESDVKMSKVWVTRLRKPSRRTVASDHGR